MHKIMARRGIRNAVLCAATSCACLAALISPAVSQAKEVNIGTGGPFEGESQGHFGDPATSTYGEVITAPENGNLLDSFTFYLKVSTSLGFHAYVYAWNGESASGSLLYESPTEHTTEENAFQAITVATGGIAVTPTQKYVIFFSVSKNESEDAGTGAGGEFATTPGSDYPEGLGVWLENGYNFEELTTSKWNTTSLGAFAFDAKFSSGTPSVSSVSPTSVSEGETVTIEGANLEGASEVLFGSTPAPSIATASDEEITAVVPSGVSGTVDVHVVTGAGESPSGSGDRVTITGGTTTTTTTTSKTPTTTTTTTTSKTTTTTTTTTAPTTTTTTSKTTTTTPTTTTTTTPTTTTTTTTKNITTSTSTATPTTTTSSTSTSSSTPTTTTTTTTSSCHKNCTTPTTTTTTTTSGGSSALGSGTTSNTPATTTNGGVTGISGALSPAKVTTNAPDCVVPELHGLTMRATRLALRAAHCALGAEHHAFSGHKKDRVYRQSLKKGTVWPNGHRVNVWDSLGLPPLG